MNASVHVGGYFDRCLCDFDKNICRQWLQEMRTSCAALAGADHDKAVQQGRVTSMSSWRCTHALISSTLDELVGAWIVDGPAVSAVWLNVVMLWQCVS